MVSDRHGPAEPDRYHPVMDEPVSPTRSRPAPPAEAAAPDPAAPVPANPSPVTPGTATPTAATPTAMTPEIFAEMFEHSPVGIGMADEHGRFVAVNPALCRLFGRPEDEVLGSSSAPWTHPDDRAAHGDAGDMIRLSPEGVAQIRKRYLRPDGEVRWAWLSFTHCTGPEQALWTIAHMQDVTDLVLAGERVRESERRLRTVIETVAELPTAPDVRQAVVHAARRMLDAQGAILTERAEGTNRFRVTAATEPAALGMVTPVEDGSVVLEVWRTGTAASLGPAEIAADPHLSLHAHDVGALELVPVRIGDETIAMLAVGRDSSATGGLDPAGLVPLLAAQTAMAVHQAVLLRRLEQLAATDELSGLPNRRSWSDRLNLLMTSVRGSSRALLVAMADLDRFKEYNDAHGHIAGDELIRAFAVTAQAALADEQVVLCRWGGEEFAVAQDLDDADDPETAEAALRQLRAAVPHGQTCSIGYAIWDGRESAEQLLARADRALYRAKLEGRDRIVRHDATT